MLYNLTSIRDIEERGRWDFSIYSPNYERVMKLIRQSKWDEVSLGQIVDFFRYGASIPADYTEEGIKFIRAQNIRETGIDQSDICYVSDDLADQVLRYRLEKGDILITRSGINVGDAALITRREENSIHGSYSIRLRLRKALGVSSDYITVALNSSLVRRQVLALKGRSAQPNINIRELGGLLIPLPPRPVQDRIAQLMQDAYATRREKLAEAESLLAGIDAFVLESLGIHPESVSEETRFLKPIADIRNGRFDVEFNMGFHKFDPYLDSVEPVQSVATFPTETRNPTLEAEKSFQYIDIASIDVSSGQIIETKEIMGQDAPSRARQVVRRGDIILSTVRPTRGATAMIPDEMDDYICSTGFTIVRAKQTKVLPEYLHTALRLSTTREQLGRRSSGSSYPAVLTKDIKAVLIPVPEISTQRSIVSEVQQRRFNSNQLKSDAESIVIQAKSQVERLILGEESVSVEGN